VGDSRIRAQVGKMPTESLFIVVVELAAGEPANEAAANVIRLFASS